MEWAAAVDAELAGEGKQEADAGSCRSVSNCCRLMSQGKGLILAPGQLRGPPSKSGISLGSTELLPG